MHLTTKGIASCANLLRELLSHLVFAYLTHLVFGYLVCEHVVNCIWVAESLAREVGVECKTVVEHQKD